MRTVGPAEDRHLLAALAGGDLTALQKLYEAYASLVYQILLLHTANTQDAEDLLQEVFLSLIELGRGVTRIRNVRAYLLKVALNKASQLYARGKPMQLDLHNTNLADTDNLRPQSRMDAFRVQEALSQLPLEQREAVILKVWHECTFAEIAEIFNIPINTAASRYRYGLEKLQQILGDSDE